jgi:hypothetical protein
MFSSVAAAVVVVDPIMVAVVALVDTELAQLQ